jgi:subtilase family serine protease
MISFILTGAFPPMGNSRVHKSQVQGGRGNTKFCMVLYNIFGLQYGTSFMSPFWCQKFNVAPQGYSFHFFV